jgi:hypothetical protein
MTAAAKEGRGAALLLLHCAAIARMTGEPHRAAYDRLADSLGPDLARRLVQALAGEKPMRAAPFWTSQLEVA